MVGEHNLLLHASWHETATA